MDDARKDDQEERAYYALNRKVYRWLAPLYDAIAFPLRKLRAEAAGLADARPGVRILDVATGTGEQALAFAALGAEVIGVDISAPMLRVAGRKNQFANATFVEADATALPFADESFDAVSISFAMHEMPEGIRDRVLREMRRVTKPNATILLIDYALPRNALVSAIVFRFVRLYERDHYPEFVRSDLPSTLLRAGLDLREEHPSLFGAARILVATPRATRHEADSSRSIAP